MRILYLFCWLLNVPYTSVGVLLGVLSIPQKVFVVQTFGTPTIVMRVRTLRWMLFFPKAKGITFGSTVLLGPLETPEVLQHELVHVEQFLKLPFIFPALYWLELIRHGYWKNKYEVEAYDRALKP